MRKNLELNNNQGWEKEKNQGLVKNNGANSITSPNINPGVCIRQLVRVPTYLAPNTYLTGCAQLVYPISI